jgi:hypothetical protein
MYHQTSPPSSQADASVTFNAIGADETRTPAVVAAAVDSISCALEKQIIDIEQRLESLKDKPADDLVHDLQIWARGAEESASAAITAAQNAIIHAWGTGSLLNMAKHDLGHGRFGSWRDSKACEIGISKRTAQNWMKLAARCWDVRALLTPGTSLTGAYRAAGVLPDPAPDPPGEEDQSPDGVTTPAPPAKSLTVPVFSYLAQGRKHLRHLVESGELLDDEERDRLEEEKSAFVTLIDKLLNPTIP